MVQKAPSITVAVYTCFPPSRDSRSADSVAGALQQFFKTAETADLGSRPQRFEFTRLTQCNAELQVVRTHGSDPSPTVPARPRRPALAPAGGVRVSIPTHSPRTSL